MEKTLTLEPSDQEAADMQAAFARCIAEIDELREEMHREREALEESGRQIDANLARIDGVLIELRAA